MDGQLQALPQDLVWIPVVVNVIDYKLRFAVAADYFENTRTPDVPLVADILDSLHKRDFQYYHADNAVLG